MIDRARLVAPKEDGSVLFEPPRVQFADLLEDNRARLRQTTAALLDRSLAELRRLARREAWQQACAYHAEAGEPALSDGQPESFVVGGHQPELFHPGVWFKNFALNELARAGGAVPLNLIVDSDNVKGAALRLPGWPAGRLPDVEPRQVQRALLPFDREGPEAPFEERRVLDEELFASVPERARAHTRHWPFTPMLDEFWSEMRRASSPLLGERIVRARRAYERRWGCHNLEVPLSRLCGTTSFAWFAVHLLAELPRFHDVYNQCLAAYRRKHRVRSRAHPVPELIQDGKWLETPFWGWTASSARRLRVFAKYELGGCDVRLGQDGPSVLSVPWVADRAVTNWQQLAERGIKIRSRALTTTLFARLFLADVFVHGIGGAKYDELTDAIVRQFYGLEPPGFVAVSGTLRLPLPGFASSQTDERRLQHAIRDHHWNPQRYLGAVEGQLAKAMSIYADYVGHGPIQSGLDGRMRFNMLRAAKEVLRGAVRARIEDFEGSLIGVRAELHANAILARRDHAFCLFPEDLLRTFLMQK